MLRGKRRVSAGSGGRSRGSPGQDVPTGCGLSWPCCVCVCVCSGVRCMGMNVRAEKGGEIGKSDEEKWSGIRSEVENRYVVCVASVMNSLDEVRSAILSACSLPTKRQLWG